MSLFQRRRAAIHKRLMLFATLAVINAPPLAHLISETRSLFLLPGIIMDAGSGPLLVMPH